MFRVVLIDGKKKYMSKIVGDSRYNYWNLGEPILKNYNMVFNYEDNTVGFTVNQNINEGNSLLSEINDISNGKCHYISEDLENEQRYIKLICDYDLDIKNIPDVIFYLKGFELKLRNIDMFRVVLIDGKKKYMSKIVGDSRYSFWNLGEPILKNYNMVFNYEDNTVGFSVNENIREGDWTMTIILGIIFIIIGSLAVYLISNRKKLFARIRSKDIEKFTKGEMLNPGSQMGEIMES